ncbi:MAG: cyclophilin-like fold protein [bacterium]
MARGRKIRIRAGTVTAVATLTATPTADKIWSALPLNARANTWGDEVYFSIPVQAPLERDAREVVSAGDLGYWPPETAFCIFFGRTPVSTGDEIRPASAVNVIGRVVGDPTVFKQVRSGMQVTLEQA